MFASSLIVPVLIAQLALPVSPTTNCRFERLGDAQRDAQAIAAFDTAVTQYAELHRRLARPMAPLALWSDGEQAAAARVELRARIRDARPNASVGQIFTPDAADVLRFRIRQAVVANGYDAAAMGEASEGEDAVVAFVVGQPLPWGAQESYWPGIEAALPPLPLELAYAFVGRDLVLIDTDADMVVDVLDLALPLR